MKEKEILPSFQMKSSYKLNYILNKIPEELIINVELKMTDGLLKPRHNVYEGFATVNGIPYNDVDLSHCVDARLCALYIGKKLQNEIMIKCKSKNKIFKIIDKK